MKETIVKCDICGNQKGVKELTLPIKFLTEQNEGKYCEPYISMTKIDICNECLMKSTNINAFGCMGYNTYVLSDKENK